MPMPDVAGLIAKEYAFFESQEQCAAFSRHVVTLATVRQSWAYGPASHDCHVVARTVSRQFVYCATGFGPDFPWSLQALGATDLGMDGMWHAFLYECVVGSEIWPTVPPGFVVMGPGERRRTLELSED